jgi:serine protease Do
VIVSFDGQMIAEMHDLPYLVAQTPVGETVAVEVVRKGSRRTLDVKIHKLQEETKASADKTGGDTPNLGIVVREVTPDLAKKYNLSEESGIAVLRVAPGSPAAEAGLKPGDVIIEVDQKPVDTMKVFMEKIQTYQKGDTMLLLVNRKGATQFLTLEIG